jgi:uncharacterized membrane protein
MTAADWIATVGLALTLLIAASGAFGYLLKENRAVRREADTSLDAFRKESLAMLSQTMREIEVRFCRLEGEQKATRTEAADALNRTIDVFSRTCEALQEKLEDMTTVMVGKYVPRTEIDARFNRIEEKQDKIIDLLRGARL